MQKITCFFFFMLSLAVYGQNVTIRPSGITPALSGTYPRLSYEAIQALPSPNEGDIAYDNTFKCLRVYSAGKWLCTYQSIENYVPNIVPVFTAGDLQNDAITDMAVSSNGDIYLAGYFTNHITLDTISISTSYSPDVFLAKFDKNGKVYWVQTITASPESAVIAKIGLDANENVYITGFYWGSATFGTTTVNSVGQYDFFLAKYNKNGVFGWVRSAGSSNIDEGSSLAFDSGGNVYVAGHFSGSVNFGPATITSTESSNDIFIAKYNTSGTLQWVLSAGGTGSENVGGIAVDNSGNVYVTGSFFGATKFGATTFTSLGSSDIYVAKYSPVSLTWSWARRSGGANIDFGKNISVDSNGGVFVMGSFIGTASLGGISKISRGNRDIFLLKYNSSGSTEWVQTAGGVGNESPNSLAIGPDGAIYLIGTYNETLEIGGQFKICRGGNDTWVARYSTNGVFSWVKTFGGMSEDSGMALGFNGSGQLHVGGSFWLTVNFDAVVVNSNGGQDMFVIRFDK